MQTIISHFSLANEVLAPKSVNTGIINDSYCLPAAKAGGVSYFLQRINTAIFRDPDTLQNNINIVTRHLRTKLIDRNETGIDRRVLQIVPNIDGTLYYRTPDGDCWRMYRCITDASSRNVLTPEAAEITGRAFGNFQKDLSDLDPGLLKESIPDFHNLVFRLGQLHEAIKQNIAGRVDGVRDIIDELLQNEEEMCLAERLYEEGKLIKRINHCDTKLNNIMFDNKTGEPICIVDLDTVMPGFVFSDFGDFMRTAANQAAEDEQDPDKIGVNMEIFKAYSRGYLQTADFLTDTERELLPYGCLRMTYMQTVRFLTDWLNGDTYYKIAYKQHNLVRTRAQLQLLRCQQAILPEMQASINSLS